MGSLANENGNAPEPKVSAECRKHKELMLRSSFDE